MDQPTHQPARPFEDAITGWSPDPTNFENWPNTVTVRSTEGWLPNQHGLYPLDQDPGIIADYADQADQRHLVEVDTNYKPERTSEHPVLLTRTDAIHLATALLAAAEDTFHYSRVGRLRAVEAAELLQALPAVEHALASLRSHALEDLILDTDSDPDDQPTMPAEQAQGEEGSPDE